MHQSFRVLPSLVDYLYYLPWAHHSSVYFIEITEIIPLICYRSLLSYVITQTCHIQWTTNTVISPQTWLAVWYQSCLWVIKEMLPHCNYTSGKPLDTLLRSYECIVGKRWEQEIQGWIARKVAVIWQGFSKNIARI